MQINNVTLYMLILETKAAFTLQKYHVLLFRNAISNTDINSKKMHYVNVC